MSGIAHGSGSARTLATAAGQLAGRGAERSEVDAVAERREDAAVETRQEELHAILRRGSLRSPKLVSHDAVHQFIALPRHVRILWFFAALEAPTVALRAVGL